MKRYGFAVLASLFGMLTPAWSTPVGGPAQQELRPGDLPRIIVVKVERDAAGREMSATMTGVEFEKRIMDDKTAAEVNHVAEAGRPVRIGLVQPSEQLGSALRNLFYGLQGIAALPDRGNADSWLSQWTHSFNHGSYTGYGYGYQPHYGYYNYAPHNASYGYYYNGSVYPYSNWGYNYNYGNNGYYYYYNPYYTWPTR